MNSLRRRLFVMLLLCFLAFWGLWVGLFGVFFRHEGTGLWDNSLSTHAQEIAQFMPKDYQLLAIAPVTGLSAKTWMRDDMSYQVWVNGRLLIRSPGAPEAPLKPDFLDGFERRPVHGEPWRIYAFSDAVRHIQVQVGKPQSDYEEIYRWLAGVTLISLVLMMGLLALAVRWGIRWSLAPVMTLSKTMQSRAPLDLTPLPASTLPAELRPLLDAFNDQLVQLDRAVQAERRFIVDAAHELRTPMAVLSANAQVALHTTDVTQKDASLRQLLAGVERGARLSEQLLDLARLDATRHARPRVPVDLAELITIVLGDFDIVVQQNHQRIVLQIEPTHMMGDVDELGILMRNLLDNATRYGGKGACIEVTCGKDAGGTARLRIADDGPGVPPEDRERIFDRFYRVAGTDQRGSGIGLSLVARIAQSHGARIEMGPGIGARGLGITVLFGPGQGPVGNDRTTDRA